MKLFLISVGITFALIVGYLIAAAVLVVVVSPDQTDLNRSAIAMVDFPFRGPKFVYYQFFPPTAEDFSTNPQDLNAKKAALAVGFFVANLLLYSLPVYFFLWVVGRIRKRHQGTGFSQSPPTPPQF